VNVEEEAEGFIVAGRPQVSGGAAIHTAGDHRIAMSFLVLGLAARAPVSVQDAGMISTSFPTFHALMSSLGARLDFA
jgi:3-phosphoshikimate 1-carboxyvinyltransferase